MRVWFLPYAYLDSKRLNSQHNEVHGLTTVILKGGRWGSISERFSRSVQYLAEVHERYVTEAAIRRGHVADHLSPYPTEIPKIRQSHPFKPTRDDLVADVIQLREKWEAEGYYFGVGRIDLRYAEKQLGLTEGREWEEIKCIRDSTRTLVKENKDALRSMGDLRLRDKLSRLRSGSPGRSPEATSV